MAAQQGLTVKIRAVLAPLHCVLTGGHVDELQQSPLGLRLRCTRCERTTTGVPTEGVKMSDEIKNDRMAGFELSQIAGAIAAQIHRADAIRGVAPNVAFHALDLPMRRHYLSLGEKAILLRPVRDQVINIDQHREQARASLRAIQQNRPFCVVSRRPSPSIAADVAEAASNWRS